MIGEQFCVLVLSFMTAVVGLAALRIRDRRDGRGGANPQLSNVRGLPASNLRHGAQKERG